MKVTITTEHSGSTSYRFEYANIDDIDSFIDHVLQPQAKMMGFQVKIVKAKTEDKKIDGDVGIL